MDKYYSDDVTWCSNVDCKVAECERNQMHKRKGAMFRKYFSISDFEGTKYCIKERVDDGNL